MNRTLTAGLLILTLIFALSLLGPVLAPFQIDQAESTRKVDEHITGSPFHPDSYHLMGSDVNGLDILSLLLFGARYTLFFCLGTAAIRLIFGTLMAGVAGSRTLPKFKLFQGFSAIPTMILIYYILVNINFNPRLTPPILALIHVVLFVLIGLPGSFTVMQDKIEALKKSSHVEAARSCGAGESYILRKHILPFLTEPLLMLLLRESISILVLIGQLGIFTIFIGGTIVIPHPQTFISRTYEWSGLLGFYRANILSGWAYMLLYPLGAYLFFLIGLYLCTKGLEIYFARMYKRIKHI
ncbi:MAG: hypothetical protein JEY99_07700 [Spirochaetales bacterium]|nr:hypothetical protein [Spirochaetales bacterium]